MLTLVFLFHQSDEPFLRLHLPVYMGAFRSGRKLNVIAASTDGNETDAYKFVQSLGIQTHTVDFNWDWSAALNQLLDIARTAKVDRILRMDPDELIFLDDPKRIDAMLDAYSVLAFPRFNFWYSRTQVNVNSYPDLQFRAWRLDDRIRYQGKIHEGVVFTGPPTEVAHMNNIHLYHFGDLGKENIQRRALMYINVKRREQGLPLLKKVPADQQPGATTQPFMGISPIDPNVCGLTAPFDE